MINEKSECTRVSSGKHIEAAEDGRPASFLDATELEGIQYLTYSQKGCLKGSTGWWVSDQGGCCCSCARHILLDQAGERLYVFDGSIGLIEGCQSQLLHIPGQHMQRNSTKLQHTLDGDDTLACR